MSTAVKNVLNNVVFCPVSFEDLSFELLDSTDTEAVKGAAECLAESFAGVEIDGVHISEPMTIACKLSKEDMFDYVHGYLSDSSRQNLTYIAKDIFSGNIVGVLASENFDPEEEIPVFEGNIAPMNIILAFLADLDDRLVKTIERKTGNKVHKNEYVHAFMGGSVLKDKKRFVVIKLFECLIIDATLKGYKGIIGEATNPKCVKMISEYCGFHQVYDVNGYPIMGDYSKHPVFKSVPKEISETCRIMYKPLDLQFDI
ncbi:hypothetical protein LY28_02246 [Ruminiclostridium sufflavum DSM 19573]|uniref:N-acetyltransferase domain-containing protein n=1 Tax=Ruminiclostridium sufflavum DSM 19573 TaxID=1121337 RepID=A0A318XN16_9FIRM|nr:hypothetical protein [Ruminiclostridium sufflavum]PYG87337.1 hypothetical protein LY28_02246 [Ruminiclostridium sufflavum DSM 19573]